MDGMRSTAVACRESDKFFEGRGREKKREPPLEDKVGDGQVLALGRSHSGVEKAPSSGRNGVSDALDVSSESS